MAHGVIYVATNTLTGKQYVGLTTVGVTRRWSNHVTYSRSPKTYLHRAIAKYGASAFNVTEYASAIKKEFLALLEKDVIVELAPEYNQTSGGEVTFGRKYDDAAKERIRLSNTGKKRTPEQCAAARLQKLAWFDAHPEQRDIQAHQLAAARLLVDERKRVAAVAASAGNRIWSVASRAKLSAACTGRMHKAETLAKISAAKKRKVRCDSTNVVYPCRVEAAQACGVSASSVHRVCNGKYPSVKGLKFSYVG